MISLKDKILKKLSFIIDSDLKQNIVKLGFVKNIKIDKDNVEFDIELSISDLSKQEKIRNQAIKFVKQIKEINGVQVNIIEISKNININKIKHIIAVSSCKGGVGKSSVAVNLAFSLAKTSKVGILDADIYGPSLPTLVDVKEYVITIENNLLSPIMYNGVKLVSVGFLNNNLPIISKGPKTSKLIKDLALNTCWGELDYLIVDFPGGTGDIQMTLSQSLNFNGAIIVTSPNQLSYTDVEKGIMAFEKFKIPILCLVENLSYYEIDNVKHYIFGNSKSLVIKNKFNLPFVYPIPIYPDFSESFGIPIVLTNHPLKNIFQDLAFKIISQNAITTHKFKDKVIVEVDTQGYLKLKIDKVDKKFHPRLLYFTWKYNELQKLRIQDIPENIKIENWNFSGNSGIFIEWNNHKISTHQFEDLITLENDESLLLPFDTKSKGCGCMNKNLEW